jgi:type I restriction enzyme S subunit
LRLPLPPVEEQVGIVEVIGSLDDKIELNRRMNETLEAMAQAIFRDWFVDFGPTRRQFDGATDPVEIMGGLVSDPDRARELAALFPAKLGDDGVPEGWELRPLGELGRIAIGGLWGGDIADEKHDREFQCLRGVDLQHLRSEGHAPQTPKRFAKLQAIEKRLPTSYDVLIASSGAGPCGRPLWVADDNFFMRHGPTIYSNFVKRITCRTPADACYLDRILHNMRLSGEISAFIGGTSVPNLNDNSLLKTRMTVISPAALREAFLSYAVLVQQSLFSEQSRTLAATRDLLLPKLMSGEIRLHDADKVGAEAAE